MAVYTRHRGAQAGDRYYGENSSCQVGSFGCSGWDRGAGRMDPCLQQKCKQN